MRNWALLNRAFLNATHYTMKADPKRRGGRRQYFLNLRPRRVEKLRRLAGDNFNIIVIGDEEVETDYFVIPYSIVKSVLSATTLSVQSRGAREVPEASSACNKKLGSPRWLIQIADGNFKVFPGDGRKCEVGIPDCYAPHHNSVTSESGQLQPKSPLSLTREFELKWRLGARTAGLIVGVAKRFTAAITLSYGGPSANARDIMDLLALQPQEHRRRLADALARGASCDEINLINRASGLRAGSRITVTVKGQDAIDAMDALANLLSCGWRVVRCPHGDCPLAPAVVGCTADTITYSCYDGHTWIVHV